MREGKEAMTSALLPVLKLGVIVVGILVAALPAWGQGPIQPRPSPWSFELTPYLWLAAFSGDLSARGVDASVDAKARNILRDLDFGAMLAAELRYDRWGLLFDSQYIKMSKDADTPRGLFSDADVESRTVVLAPALAYRAVWLDRFTLDALAGVRVWIVENEIELEPGLLPGVKVAQEKTWADPIIGLRAGLPLADTVSLTAYGDVGGFGAGSDLTWQGLATFNWRFSPHWALRAGYRALGVNFERGGFELDVIQHGPILGISYRF
jgi:hypothetical protein